MGSWPTTHRAGRKPQEHIYIERLPAGWRVMVDGAPQVFGTSFLAVHTAETAARALECAGRRCDVLIQREDGGWRGVNRHPDSD